jgi:hypothetical protein
MIRVCNCDPRYDMWIRSTNHRGEVVDIDSTNHIVHGLTIDYPPLVRRTVRGVIGGPSYIGPCDMVELARGFTGGALYKIRMSRHYQSQIDYDEMIITIYADFNTYKADYRWTRTLTRVQLPNGAEMEVYYMGRDYISNGDWILALRSDICKIVSANSPLAGCTYYVSSYKIRQRYDVVETDIDCEFASALLDMVDDETAMIIASLGQ